MGGESTHRRGKVLESSWPTWHSFSYQHYQLNAAVDPCLGKVIDTWLFPLPSLTGQTFMVRVGGESPATLDRFSWTSSECWWHQSDCRKFNNCIYLLSWSHDQDFSNENEQICRLYVLDSWKRIGQMTHNRFSLITDVEQLYAGCKDTVVVFCHGNFGPAKILVWGTKIPGIMVRLDHFPWKIWSGLGITVRVRVQCLITIVVYEKDTVQCCR